MKCRSLHRLSVYCSIFVKWPISLVLLIGIVSSVLFKSAYFDFSCIKLLWFLWGRIVQFLCVKKLRYFDTSSECNWYHKQNIISVQSIFLCNRWIFRNGLFIEFFPSNILITFHWLFLKCIPGVIYLNFFCVNLKLKLLSYIQKSL